MQRFFFLILVLLLLTAPAPAKACEPSAADTPLTLRINSVYPNPLTGEKEWIEIKNTGTGSVDLSLYSVEDATENPWVLSGTLDSQALIQVQGFPFQLNNGGDTVTLKTQDGTIVDQWVFEASTAGEILLRDAQVASEDPTVILSDSEETQSTPLFWPDFSEALPNPEGSDSTLEWIELYNPTDLVLTLDGLKIDDMEGGSPAHALSGSLDPESYFVIWVEDSGISLNNTDDSIRLLGANDEVLWEISYSNPKEGESYALINGNLEWTNQATPGTDNLPYLETGTESSSTEADTNFLNGDLSESVEITEVFPNPEGPDADTEWIEITNGGTETVNLGNWVIDDGEGGSDPFTLPDSTELSPGESLVIERSESGIALNNTDETVTLTDFSGEVVDQIDYESSEEGMSFALIEIEELSSTQAALEGFGNPLNFKWIWGQPSPGERNPSWSQIKGEVVDFESGLLTLFDGVTNWTLEAENDPMNEMLFQKKNELLVRATLINGLYKIMETELLSAAEKKSAAKIPWGLIALTGSAGIFGLYEWRKKSRLNSPILTG